MAAIDPLLERGLPANPEAEKAVLGAILLDNGAYNAAASMITSEDFSVDSNRRIYQRMVMLREGIPARPIDFTTLTEELLASKELEAVGGVAYLATLTDGLPRAVNTEHYARIVKDKSVLRRLIHTAHNIVQEGLDGGYQDDANAGGGISEFLDRAESAILHVGEDRIRAGLTPLDELAKDVYAQLDDMRGQRITGLETGFLKFDEMTRGLHPGELIIVAARPSMGKTAWAMNAAQSAALAGNTVAVFSLEMTKESLLMRMLCSEARIDSHKYRSGFLSREDLRGMADAMGRLAQAPLFIDDSAGLNLYEMRAKSRRLKAERGLSLIVVDYLQLMSAPKAENRNQEVSALSRGLKSLAKELEVPIMLLSQLNRAAETRGTGSNDRRPLLSDLRDSGSIEQDADVVAFLYREEYYLRMMGREIPEDVAGRAEVIIAKQRNGPTGSVKLAFMDKYASFGNIADGFE
jgi:replicative DNA helicase